MRIHYYMFPNDADYAVRIKEGCQIIQAHCDIGRHCYECHLDNSNYSCEHFHIDELDCTIGGISITSVKNLIKKYGGIGFTEHCERDGSVFDVTDITLGKNNSRFKYNHHL